MAAIWFAFSITLPHHHEARLPFNHFDAHRVNGASGDWMVDFLSLEGALLGEMQETRLQSLRSCLRDATADAHDTLDSLMSTSFGWATTEQYIAFLSVQLAARAPVERFLAKAGSQHLVPPRQCQLISADLATLRSEFAPVEALEGQRPFVLDLSDSVSSSDQDALVLGAAWTLAGSALGNRAILKEMRSLTNRHDALVRPCAFLNNREMLHFWSDLRRRIERPTSHRELRIASQAASAVFGHFIETARDCSAAKGVSAEPDRVSSNSREAKNTDPLRCPVAHS